MTCYVFRIVSVRFVYITKFGENWRDMVGWVLLWQMFLYFMEVCYNLCWWCKWKGLTTPNKEKITKNGFLEPLPNSRTMNFKRFLNCFWVSELLRLLRCETKIPTLHSTYSTIFPALERMPFKELLSFSLVSFYLFRIIWELLIEC